MAVRDRRAAGARTRPGVAGMSTLGLYEHC
jgi:hypothetical protein